MIIIVPKDDKTNMQTDEYTHLEKAKTDARTDRQNTMTINEQTDRHKHKTAHKNCAFKPFLKYKYPFILIPLAQLAFCTSVSTNLCICDVYIFNLGR